MAPKEQRVKKNNNQLQVKSCYVVQAGLEFTILPQRSDSEITGILAYVSTDS